MDIKLKKLLISGDFSTTWKIKIAELLIQFVVNYKFSIKKAFLN